nr:MAG TPA: hypothetical protein [Caudoviricetes sp.]
MYFIICFRIHLFNSIRRFKFISIKYRSYNFTITIKYSCLSIYFVSQFMIN